jgi:hypothetical protein
MGELRTYEVGDASEVPHLLARIEGAIASMTADGAHDVEGVYQTGADRQPEAFRLDQLPCRARWHYSVRPAS